MQRACSVIELGEGNEVHLNLLIAKGIGTTDLNIIHLELGKAYPSGGLGVAIDKALIDGTDMLEFVVAELEFDVWEPALLIELPVHPPLEHLEGASEVVEFLLHVDVLVSKLVDAGEEGDDTVLDFSFHSWMSY